jgi:hypothetical protein
MKKGESKERAGNIVMEDARKQEERKGKEQK